METYFIDSDSFIPQCGTMLASLFQGRPGFHYTVTWNALLINMLCKAYKAADTLFLLGKQSQRITALQQFNLTTSIHLRQTLLTFDLLPVL
jgi:hypothetical protein